MLLEKCLSLHNEKALSDSRVKNKMTLGCVYFWSALLGPNISRGKDACFLMSDINSTYKMTSRFKSKKVLGFSIKVMDL